MENNIILFSNQPIVKKYNENILKIKNDNGNLIAELDGVNETIIPFSDEGDVDEIVLVCGYKEISQDLYELYTATYYYDNEILCEGDLQPNESQQYLLVLGNHIKLFNNKNEVEKFQKSIIID